ncbi:cytochrome P450 [Hysterangium stoloniferum]|nr:cytochrome P450 [Hysterangium stoloniferum]
MLDAPAPVILVALVFPVVLSIFTATRKDPLSFIPCVGRAGRFLSFLDAIYNFWDTEKTLKEGYKKASSVLFPSVCHNNETVLYKFGHGLFRLAELSKWHVIASSKQHLEEVANAPEEVLSFTHGINDALAMEYTMGENVLNNLYHVDIFRTRLTKGLGLLFDPVRDELVKGCNEAIPVTSEWTQMRVMEAVTTIICRSSNRIFVGAPLCRDPEYVKLNIQFALHITLAAHIIRLFPKFLKPLVVRFLTNVPQSIQKASAHLAPIIEERQRKIDAHGKDYPDKPNDLLSWLMDEAVGPERTARNLTLRMLITNFSAIHTTSVAFSNALFQLAARPEYIHPLREEIERVVSEEGWCKEALSRMVKLDSFLKESQRSRGISALSMMRKVLQDFTFSDGTRLPRGTYLGAVSVARQMDAKHYADPAEFRGFRFVDADAEDDDLHTEARNQMVATSTEYLVFGLGRHVCPGRFFAVLEMKCLLAHMILTYDMKIDKVPDPLWFGVAVIPDHKAETLAQMYSK